MKKQKDPYESSLEKLIVDTVKKAVGPAIDDKVNGKINGLRTEIQNYIVLDEKWKEDDKAWKDSSEAWRKTAQPAINISTNGKIIVVFLKYLATTLAGIAGLIIAIETITRAFGK